MHSFKPSPVSLKKIELSSNTVKVEGILVKIEVFILRVLVRQSYKGKISRL